MFFSWHRDFSHTRGENTHVVNSTEDVSLRKMIIYQNINGIMIILSKNVCYAKMLLLEVCKESNCIRPNPEKVMKEASIVLCDFSV